MKTFFLLLTSISFALWFFTDAENSKSVSILFAASAICTTALHIFAGWF